MIQEAYVSYEVAKLLKEKGFPQEKDYAIAMYDEDGDFHSLCTKDRFYYNFEDFDDKDCIAVTQQSAMAWLRKVHNIIIITYPVITDDDGECGCLWGYTIRKRLESIHENDEVYYNPEEATEAALLYVLKNLI